MTFHCKAKHLNKKVSESFVHNHALSDLLASAMERLHRQQQWAEACIQCTVHRECLQCRGDLDIAIINTSRVLINHDLMFMC